MPAGPLSRYRGLEVLEIDHPTRGVTRSLPVRRLPGPPPEELRRHRFSGAEAADLLALQYLGKEELYWYLLDANGARLPHELDPGELLSVPALSSVTRID